MTVRELIAALQEVNPESRVLMGYDGNIVVEVAREVEELRYESQIGVCWHPAKIGDVVILCA